MVALGVAVALVATGCRTDRRITRPDPIPLTEERLGNALITSDDLSSAWSEAEEGTPISTEILTEHSCDDALSELEPRFEQSADFTSEDARLTSTAAYFPGGGGAFEQLLRTIVRDCNDTVATEEGVTIRAGGLDFGVLSDDTLALRFEVEPETGIISERDIILIREGDLVGLIRLTGPRPSDKVVLDTVARLMIGRIGLLANETAGR